LTTEDLQRPPEASANPEQPSPPPKGHRGGETESAWAFWRSVLITLLVAIAKASIRR
jgi:hypothetical protein